MILFSGANGQLGFELQRLFKEKGVLYSAFDLDEWDICDSKKTDELIGDLRPDILINCAAYTAVDKAESEDQKAFEINAAAPARLKSICLKSDIFFVHISTDFVFGDIVCNGGVEGRETSVEAPLRRPIRPWRPDDETSPMGVYGKSKYMGEQATLDENKKKNLEEYENTLIVRTSWLYSSSGSNFPKTILRLASDEQRKNISVVEDQIGRPTWARRLAEFLYLYLLEKKLLNRTSKEKIIGGMYHFSNSGTASWYDFAKAVVEIGFEAGILKEKKPVYPVPTSSYPTLAPRPGFSVMDIESARSIMPDIPHWREDLRLFFHELNEK